MRRLAISLLLLVGTLSYGAETTIYSFKGGSDGSGPVGGMVRDSNGNLYGMTEYGGTGNCGSGSFAGCGTVFELSPDGHGGWAETVIYSFAGGADGQIPVAGLILDAQGNLYGTTQGDGVAPNYGSAFELSPSGNGWVITVLHTFRGGNDGGGVEGPLAMDSAGNLYGTTASFGPKGGGTTFQLTNSGSGWKLKNIHAFSGESDGDQPEGQLVLGSGGAVYGTTRGGGTCCGVFYSLSQNSKGVWVERVLHAFTGGHDGGTLLYGLSADQQGNLYGASPKAPEWGEVFQFSPAFGGKWNRKTLYVFRPLWRQGPEDPSGPVTIDASGNVYGVTSLGGPSGTAGTVYRLTPGDPWGVTVLYAFSSDSKSGTSPFGQLVLDGNGNLYGSAIGGGTGCSDQSCGLIFEITQ
jgi:uncharacterized repeat protein (TIGR03803 family)